MLGLNSIAEYFGTLAVFWRAHLFWWALR